MPHEKIVENMDIISWAECKASMTGASGWGGTILRTEYFANPFSLLSFLLNEN
jgi:hypothetical protein